MVSFPRIIYRRLFKPFIGQYVNRIRVIINKMGKKYQCYICGNTFHHFIKHRGGKDKASAFLKNLQVVGSDLDNFGCVYCGCNDRERHLFMFFDKLNFWEQMRGKSVLHFAPEFNLSKKIQTVNPEKYYQADLYPKTNDELKIDVTDIPFEESSTDIVICNHVLEHVVDYRKGMAEIYRIMKPGGSAILQTPYSEILSSHFEDVNIIEKSQKEFFYGQDDHVRLFSKIQFFQDLTDTGFKVEVIKNSSLFDSSQAAYYGVNHKEDLILALK